MGAGVWAGVGTLRAPGADRGKARDLSGTPGHSRVHLALGRRVLEMALDELGGSRCWSPLPSHLVEARGCTAMGVPAPTCRWHL